MVVGDDLGADESPVGCQSDLSGGLRRLRAFVDRSRREPLSRAGVKYEISPSV